MLTHRLQLTLLGPYQVLLNGQPITDFAADSARALLAYLALHPNQLHSRDHLAELFWPSQARDKGLTNLRAALNRLRSALGDQEGTDALILVTRQMIGLTPALTLQIDVVEVERLTAAIRTHSHRSLDRCPQCVEQIRHVVDLYRGSFLAGLSVDSAAFDEWQRTYEEHLHDVYQEMLYALTAFYFHRHDFTEAIQSARRQLALEAWNERAQRQLMQALAANGQRSAALVQYKRCAAALLQELGVEPEAATNVLAAQIRAGELTPPPALPGIHTLPVLTTLHGRQRELAALTARLVSPTQRLITVVGIGGIGKTRLAVAAGDALRGCFADGIWFVPLSGIEATAVPAIEEAIAAKILEVLGHSASTDGARRTQLLATLAPQELLLILDNFEHLAAGCNLLSDLLTAAPRLTLLVTSRIQLDLSVGAVYPLYGLDYPGAPLLLRPGNGENCTHHTAPLAPEAYGALALFADVARRTTPTFTLAEHLEGVNRICHLVQGLPLALELAASHIHRLPISLIAHNIEQNLSLLAVETSDLPLPQRNMVAVFVASWQLLTVPQQILFTQLAVFTGGFTLAAAQAVTGATQADLTALLRAMFLELDSVQERYHLHDLLRQYGIEKLALCAELKSTARQRHAAYFAQWLSGVHLQLRSPKTQEALAAIALDLGNLTSAWHWAAQQQQVEWLEQLMEGLHGFHLRHHRYPEGAELCRSALAQLQASERAPVLVMRALLLVWLGRYNQILGDLPGAEAQNQEAMMLVDAVEQQTGVAPSILLPIRAHVLMQRGHQLYDRNSEEADQFHRQALTLYQQLGDRWNEAHALAALARNALAFGRPAQAEALNHDALALRTLVGAPTAIATSMLDLAINALAGEQFTKAEHLLRSARQLYQESADAFGMARCMGTLGTLYARMERYGEALPLLTESIQRLEQIQHQTECAEFLAEAAFVYLQLGDTFQAQRVAHQGLALAQQIHHQPATERALAALTALAAALQQQQVGTSATFLPGAAAHFVTPQL